MNRISSRPLYSTLAWAYDLIIAGPVSDRCDFVQSMATQRGVLPGSSILDAGCGTGSYSIELAKRGYAITGLDNSSELISLASAKAEKVAVTAIFQVGDILELPSRPIYDGILCRGVLNDIIGDPSRRQAFFSLARALHKNSILILDVREWTSSTLRKEREPVFERVVEVNEGILTFRAVTRLDKKTRRLCVAESYVLERGDAVRTVTEYDFVMQCWTPDELHSSLIDAGFGSVVYFGDYDSDCPAGSTDRIIAVASV
ncbi:MAG: class I SAM-dependent methyltransferase [candidate division Zixibacteria bacterium]|nr:class I SAM-dependent methyltransferase [candidate division Zixibacteria bacterium]